MKNGKKLAGIFGCLILLAGGFATASAPSLISYQGRLLDSNGDPVTDTVNLNLAIYADSSTGSPLWSESQSGVEIIDGRFNVLLGETNPIGDSAFSGPDRWLGVTVNSESEMQPRIRLTSTPYSHRVATVDGASGGTISGDVDIASDLAVSGAIDATGNFHASGTVASGNSIIVDGVNDKITASSGKIDFDNEDLVTTGKIGIGTTSPFDPLHIEGVGLRQIRIVDPNVNSNGWGLGHIAGLAGDQFVITDQQRLTDRLIIDSLGNVGIGTLTPAQKLDVGGTIYSRSGGFKFPDGSVQTTAATGGGGGGWVDDGSVVRLATSSDKVGIGTSSPTELFEVVGTGGAGMALRASASGQVANFGMTTPDRLWFLQAGGTNKGFRIRDGSAFSDRFGIDTLGRVGIGTTSPTEQLQVLGTIHSTTGGFKFPDGSVQTTASVSGGLSSVDSVSNPGGNVDLISQNAISITPNDVANTITIGETHSARTDNPHSVTSAQTGALVSVDGVQNAGGNVDFIAGANMTITPNDGANTVTFSAVSGVNYAQVFTVALSGGDFTSIGAALAACASPSSSNPYLIRVMPGVYGESVVCSSFVRLQGAGKYASYITGSVTAADSCTIDGFNIEGGIVCSGTSPTITHNIVKNGGGDGISVTSPGRPWIKQNEIQDCSGWGVHCSGFGSDAWIIANKIERNTSGGIRCTDSSPTISNNQILENDFYGIFLIGALGSPSEPTIDDNVIGRTDPGVGIYMTDYAEPRVIANDIWINETAIEIHPNSQPSILANNINYNQAYGIRCFSSGSSKPVVIKGNHIHSSFTAGLDVVDASPIVTHNNIHNNGTSDVQYSATILPLLFPMISFNVYDNINRIGGTAGGLYNVTSVGGAIGP